MSTDYDPEDNEYMENAKGALMYSQDDSDVLRSIANALIGILETLLRINNKLKEQ